MGLLNAIVRATKYVMTGEDTVIREMMEERIGRVENVDLRREWREVEIEYGANRMNPNHLSDKMKAIYMQCVTVFSERSGASHDRSQSYTETHRQHNRLTTKWRGDDGSEG